MVSDTPTPAVSLSGSREELVCSLVSICPASIRSRQASGHLFGSSSVPECQTEQAHSGWVAIDLLLEDLQTSELTSSQNSHSLRSTIQC